MILEKCVIIQKGLLLRKIGRTRFPIIPILAENLKEEDQIKVVVLRTLNEDTQDNLSYLMKN